MALFRKKKAIKKLEEPKLEESPKKVTKITDFCVKVARLEKGKKEINIAQIAEIVKVINELLGGRLYQIIRGKEPKKVKEIKSTVRLCVTPACENPQEPDKQGRCRRCARDLGI